MQKLTTTFPNYHLPPSVIQAIRQVPDFRRFYTVTYSDAITLKEYNLVMLSKDYLLAGPNVTQDEINSLLEKAASRVAEMEIFLMRHCHLETLHIVQDLCFQPQLFNCGIVFERIAVPKQFDRKALKDI